MFLACFRKKNLERNNKNICGKYLGVFKLGFFFQKHFVCFRGKNPLENTKHV
jgi:hypothetical protein